MERGVHLARVLLLLHDRLIAIEHLREGLPELSHEGVDISLALLDVALKPVLLAYAQILLAVRLLLQLQHRRVGPLQLVLRLLNCLRSKMRLVALLLVWSKEEKSITCSSRFLSASSAAQ